MNGDLSDSNCNFDLPLSRHLKSPESGSVVNLYGLTVTIFNAMVQRGSLRKFWVRKLKKNCTKRDQRKEIVKSCSTICGTY